MALRCHLPKWAVVYPALRKATDSVFSCLLMALPTVNTPVRSLVLPVSTVARVVEHSGAPE